MKPRMSIYFLVLSIGTVAACNRPKTDDADAAVARGAAWEEKGDYDRAISAYDTALTLRPNSPAILRSRGVAYAGKGEYDRAIAEYDKAIALKPDFASAIANRGFALQFKGEYERAIQDYDHALQLKPDLANARKNRGRTHFYLGHFPEAIADMRQAQNTDSANIYLGIWLQMAAKRLGQNANQEITAQLARIDTVKWPAPVARYYLDKITRDQLLAAAADTNADTHKLQSCTAAFYIGEFALWNHKTAEAATRFQETVATCPKTATEYQGAEAELKRLGVVVRR